MATKTAPGPGKVTHPAVNKQPISITVVVVSMSHNIFVQVPTLDIDNTGKWNRDGKWKALGWISTANLARFKNWPTRYAILWKLDSEEGTVAPLGVTPGFEGNQMVGLNIEGLHQIYLR